MFLLFEALGTQWRTGAMGLVGLDYNVAYHKMDRMGLEPERYEAMESDLRVMEDAALKELRRKR